MDKCRDCNSTLMAGELQCYNCGAPVKVVEPPQAVFVKRFLKFLNVAFILSAVATALHLFLEFKPSFMQCLMVTFILLLIRSSASQMIEKPKD